MTRSAMLATVLFLSLTAVGEEDATHVEARPFTPGGRMLTMSMDHDGNLLCGIKGNGFKIRKMSQDGDHVATIRTRMPPVMIEPAGEGRLYVAGGGVLALIDEEGEILHEFDYHEVAGDEAHAAGLTVGGGHVFFAVGFGWSLRATEDIYRLDLDLTNHRRIVEEQYGCCAHIDLQVVGEELLIAENSRFRVNRFDFDGERLGRWGRKDRNDIEGFSACCNPVCIDLGPNGDDIYTAESGVGRIKRYSPEGKFLGVVGYVDTTRFMRGSRRAAASCYIPVEVSDDGSRVFVMDVRANAVRVLVDRELVERR